MRYILLFFIFTFVSTGCVKRLEPTSITGEVAASDATTQETLLYQKQGINGYYPSQSDTMYAARTPNYAVLFAGNSLPSNWRYYNWALTWKGLPVVNRAVPGKTDKERFPWLQLSTYDYTPKVWVYYGEENVFLRASNQWTALAEAKLYFGITYDNIRRKYPHLRMIVHSMMTCPTLYNKGFSPAIDSFNVFLKGKITADATKNSRWVDIRVKLSHRTPAYYQSDGIHLNNNGYIAWAAVLKPVVTEVYNIVELKPVKTAMIGIETVRLWKTNYGVDTTFGIPLTSFGYNGYSIFNINDRLHTYVTPEKFEQIIVYAGDNDLTYVSEAGIISRYKNLIDRSTLNNPQAILLFISIKPQWNASYNAVAKRVNATIKAHTATKSNARYVDVHSKMILADGRPNSIYYVTSTNLQLNAKGYELWESILKEHMIKM